jgi:hypothetical protein
MLVKYRKAGEFDAVKEDLLLAIRDKGLVLDYTSHVGNMLERTGKDVGSAKRIFLKAEAYLFCSAVVSRRTMEADAANVGYCPYAISLYVTPHEPKVVHAVYRKTLPEVDKLLDGIVRDALEIK